MSPFPRTPRGPQLTQSKSPVPHKALHPLPIPSPPFSPSHSPLTHSVPGTLTSLLLLKHTKDGPASGPLLFPHSRTFFLEFSHGSPSFLIWVLAHMSPPQKPSPTTPFSTAPPGRSLSQSNFFISAFVTLKLPHSFAIVYDLNSFTKTSALRGCVWVLFCALCHLHTPQHPQAPGQLHPATCSLAHIGELL